MDNHAKTILYDQGADLLSSFEQAVGPKSRRNVNPAINNVRFPPRSTGIMEVKLTIVNLTWRDVCNGEDPVSTLAKRGYNNLGDGWDLAFFLRQYPNEVANWPSVCALSQNSRLVTKNGPAYFPCISSKVANEMCYFFVSLVSGAIPGDGVIVIC